MRFSRNSVDNQLAVMHLEGEKRDAMRRAEKEHLPHFELKSLPSKKILNLIPEAVAKAAKLAVVDKKEKEITLVVFSMENKRAKDVVASLKEKGITSRISITTLSTLENLWMGYKKAAEEKEGRKKITSKVKLNKEKIDKVRKEIKSIKDVEAFFEKVDKNTETSSLLGYILGAALALKSSDIHIEHTAKDKALLRFRIDGNLRDIISLEKKPTRLLISRVKLLAGLKLNITSSPQDGRFTIESPESDIEVRSSMIPAEFGEALVMRVLDPAIIGLELKDLGLRKDDEEIISRELKRPNGMILVTGPTGSGKTTTLYAFLKRVTSPEVKIITIEDPIEYHLKGIQQTQTDRANNYTFATGLRSILRQDPDIILIGEIRDAETAGVSINSALTGHLVFSTLHTNNASGAIPRLLDLGIKPSTIGPAVVLVIAQRLVRRLCENCKKEMDVSEELKNKLEKILESLPKKISRDSMKIQLYKAVGCDECEDGYVSRIAIVELLEIGDKMDALIREKATEKDIEDMAVKEQGMVSMQKDAILKAIKGTTTIEEIERVTGPIE